MTQPDATPILSVVVACYNASAFLERCVASILGQTLTSLEIILVDDCSTDATLAMAHAIAQTDARVRVIESSINGGPGGARNRGFAAATGRWIGIVDSDDLLHPARFATLVEAADAVQADMIADDLLVFDDGSAEPGARFLTSADQGAAFDLDLAEYLRRSPLYGGQPNLGFLKPLIRRDRLVASGVRYDETLRIAEDDDLVARLLLAGLRYRLVPQPFYFYRKHGSSISHRLSVATVTAMRVANARLVGAILAVQPDLARICATRTRSFDRAGAFEEVIAALKQRRIGAAVGTLLGTPGAWPLLRMPLMGAVRKLLPKRTVAVQAVAPDAEMAILCAQADRMMTPLR